MPNDFVPNHVITDHMGFNIANSLKDIASALGGGGGGSSDSPFVVVHVVGRYPGEGEDPHAGGYIEDAGRTEPVYWLDITYGEIKKAFENGKVIFVAHNSEPGDFVPVEERDAEDTLNATSWLMALFCYEYDSTDTNLINLVVNPVSAKGSALNFFALSDSDYPSDLKIDDPDHPYNPPV